MTDIHNETNPQVSVIIPVFNGEKYIRQALESVFAQTYKDYEIIVIDDGSTDSTLQILKPFRNRIKYIYQDNKGVAGARNEGIKNARGRYLALLDSDDVWLPEKLEYQVNYLNNHIDVAFVYSDFQTFDEKGVINDKTVSCFNSKRPSGYIFNKLFFNNFCATSTVLLNKEYLDKVGFFDESFKIGEEYDLWLRISRHFKIGYINRVLSMYRKNPQSISKNVVVGYSYEIKVIEKALLSYPDIKNEMHRKVIDKRLSIPYFDVAYYFFYANQITQARKLFFKAIILWPTNINYILYYISCFLPPSMISIVRKLKMRFLKPLDSVRYTLSSSMKRDAQ